ncbi:MAG: DUF1674 domain-containing protein [Gammaproteobacteria bacterium]
MPPIHAAEPASPPSRDTDVVPLAELLRAQNDAPAPAPAAAETEPGRVPEIGGRQNGLEPTRYGDWEKNGRCIDF